MSRAVSFFHSITETVAFLDKEYNKSGFVDMLMSVYRHNDYDSEDLEEKLIKARYFHDLLHAVGRSHQIKLTLIIQSFIHDKKHAQSRR